MDLDAMLEAHKKVEAPGGRRPSSQGLYIITIIMNYL
jgi:hypothetical protein